MSVQFQYGVGYVPSAFSENPTVFYFSAFSGYPTATIQAQVVYGTDKVFLEGFFSSDYSFVVTAGASQNELPSSVTFYPPGSTLTQVGLWDINLIQITSSFTGIIQRFKMSESYIAGNMTPGETYTVHLTFLSSQYSGDYEIKLSNNGTYCRLTTPLVVENFQVDASGDFGFLTYPLNSSSYSLNRTGFWGYGHSGDHTIYIGYSYPFDTKNITVQLLFGNPDNYHYNGYYTGSITTITTEGEEASYFSSPDLPAYAYSTESYDGMIIGLPIPPVVPIPTTIDLSLVFYPYTGG